MVIYYSSERMVFNMRSIQNSFVYSSIGNDPSEVDYAIIVKDKKGVIIGKGGTSVIALDISLLSNSMFVLNYKELSTSDEAYNKFLKWIGKMIKKTSDSRYFNQKDPYNHITRENCINVSNLTEAIKDAIDRDL
jgi:hypothetical protein